jgi:hypothetical protein
MRRVQGIKIKLRPLGFTGFKLDELTPNKTRRAQCVNWLLFYRSVQGLGFGLQGFGSSALTFLVRDSRAAWPQCNPTKRDR